MKPAIIALAVLGAAAVSTVALAAKESPLGPPPPPEMKTLNLPRRMLH